MYISDTQPAAGPALSRTAPGASKNPKSAVLGIISAFAPWRPDKSAPGGDCSNCAYTGPDPLRGSH